MYCISIQIRPKFAREFDQREFLDRVRPIRSPEVDTEEEKGKLFLSFNFFTEFPKALWQDLNAVLYQDAEYGPLIHEQSLAICESDEGDCLLLHHYDERESLDTL